MKSFQHILSLALLSLLPLCRPASAAERFRTDINPALLYWQAWAEMPTLPEPDHGYVFTDEWRGRVLDERFGQLISRYDHSFKLLRRAAKAEVPCEWGYDLFDGPEALLPGLAKAKALTQAARLRVMWHLQNGDQAAARDDLLGAFVLGRNISRDNILVSALVQIAIENICVSIIAENFSKFSPVTLKEILAGIDASPARGSIANCIATEKQSFLGWLARKIEDLQASSPNDAAAVEGVQAVLRNSFTEQDPQFADKVVQAAGGTSAGLLRYVREMEPLYDEVAVVLRLPYHEFALRMRAFATEIHNHTNLLVKQFFSAFEKCRMREFGAELKLAMLRAAVAYRLTGEEGLRQVLDPLLRGPFQLRRFTFEGVDRGFELRSQADWRGWGEAQIFVEKDGPPFYLDGKNAGKKVK